jgi:hypothetical protein
VTAVRRGASQRSVAASEGVALRTVQRWVERAGDQRLDRVDWADHSSRPLTTRRTPHDIEDVVLEVRERLEAGPLGEHGAEAIGRELEAMALAGLLPGPIPAVRTIGRILERRGVLDGRRRVRRPAPPPGWYLPSVADRTEELDSLDAVVGLTVTGGREVDVLTATSLHGGLGQAWPGWAVTARSTIDALTERWRAHGRPGFAQFDNDTRFHGFPAQDRSLGRVVRFCLSMGVVPVFPPPLETGFQAAIENLNGRWQRALWRREPFTTMEDLRAPLGRLAGGAGGAPRGAHRGRTRAPAVPGPLGAGACRDRTDGLSAPDRRARAHPALPPGDRDRSPLAPPARAGRGRPRDRRPALPRPAAQASDRTAAAGRADPRSAASADAEVSTPR